MGEETTTGFKTEGQPAFPIEDKEKDNSSESSTEKTNDDQTQATDGEQGQSSKKDDVENKNDKENLADHPRWKERENDWKDRYNEQEKRNTASVDELRQEIQKLTKGAEKGSEQTAIPSWFGGDESQWAAYEQSQKAIFEGIEQRTEERVMSKLTSKEQKEQKAIDDATGYFNEQVIEIEDDKVSNPNADKIDRNKLLKFTMDNDLVDSKGRWNYKVAFKLMKANVAIVKTDKTKEKKVLADATTSDNRGDSKGDKEVTTSKDFEKPGSKPW